MPFFEYGQNNSGGSFDPPYEVIYVEAPDDQSANAIAESEFGVYFDGCEDGRDCDCCGDRWHRPWSGKDEPKRYGKSMPEYEGGWGLKAAVRYADGRVEVFPKETGQ